MTTTDSNHRRSITSSSSSTPRYRNKQRVLVFSSRGITTRYRHFMEDIRSLLPHHKKEVKLDSKDTLQDVNDIAEMKNCNGTIFFESRKRQDLYLWISRPTEGPSGKFLVQNVHTMDELKMTGNALKGSRPLLSFDDSFNKIPHLKLIKAMFIQTWGTPLGHPKSKPFIDRIMCFYHADGKIWVRNYQIADEADSKKMEAAAANKGEELTQLIEIGPRFVLTPIRLFAGSFGGSTLYKNEKYISPNMMRFEVRSSKHDRYMKRKKSQRDRRERAVTNVLPKDELSTIFQGEN